MYGRDLPPEVTSAGLGFEPQKHKQISKYSKEGASIANPVPETVKKINVYVTAKIPEPAAKISKLVGRTYVNLLLLVC